MAEDRDLTADDPSMASDGPALPGDKSSPDTPFDQHAALVAAGNHAEAELLAIAELAASPENKQLRLAASRHQLRFGSAEVAYQRLAQGISQGPRDPQYLTMAARLVAPKDAAAVLLDTILEESAKPPFVAAVEEAAILALHNAGRSEEAWSRADKITALARRRRSTAMLLADVAAQTSRFTTALEYLDHAENAGVPSAALLEEIGKRRSHWKFYTSLAAAKDASDPDALIALAKENDPETLGEACWLALAEEAQGLSVLGQLAQTKPQLWSNSRLRQRLEAIALEASPKEKVELARALLTLPQDSKRATLVDRLLVQAGRVVEADRHAACYLLQNPGDLTLASRYIERLAERSDLETIEEICNRTLQETPGHPRFSSLLATHLTIAQRWNAAAASLRQAHVDGVERDRLRLTEAAYLIRAGLARDALALATPEGVEATPDMLDLAIEARLSLGERDTILKDMASQAAMLDALSASDEHNARRLARLKSRLAMHKVVTDCGEIVARMPLATPVRGIVVILAMRSPLILLWTVLVAVELRKRGWETVFLDAPAASPDRLIDREIATLDGLIDPTGLCFRGQPPRLAPDPGWSADPAARRLCREGIELHQAVTERVATIQRRYRVVQGRQAEGIATDALIRADVALDACNRIRELSERRGLDVMIFSSMTHYAPAAVYKKYCATQKSESRMEYVEFNVGYEQYRNNTYDAAAASVSIANMTRNPMQRTSIHSTDQRFKSWLSRQPQKDKQGNIDSILKMNRANADRAPEAERLLDRIVAHRALGGRVVCLLGKITYDIAVESEGGPAHIDMTDWLNDSIDAVRDREDVLLLIKPHPYEVLAEFARPNEFFADLITGPLPKNCVVLGHRWFNLAEIIPHIDLATIWHGTATLEILAQATPLVVCAEWGAKDHPIDVTVPVDREDYHAIMRGERVVACPPHLQERAKHLIAHLVSDEVIVPYPYGKLFALRGGGTGIQGWDHERVAEYLAHGDPWITYLADLAQHGEADPPDARAR